MNFNSLIIMKGKQNNVNLLIMQYCKVYNTRSMQVLIFPFIIAMFTRSPLHNKQSRGNSSYPCNSSSSSHRALQTRESFSKARERKHRNHIHKHNANYQGSKESHDVALFSSECYFPLPLLAKLLAKYADGKLHVTRQLCAREYYTISLAALVFSRSRMFAPICTLFAPS